MGKSRMSKKLHDAITCLSKEGDELAGRGADQAAYDKYNEAWEMVPEPKVDWEAATWILSAVGELQFRLKKLDKALNSFLRAVQCPNGLGNPYIHLRIGEAQYELGDMKGAGDNLARAYMSAGDDIFKNEDPKYLAYLRTILLPPASDIPQS